MAVRVEQMVTARAQHGRLTAAGLDVFATEPLATGNPRLCLDNVVVIPHVVWYKMDTMRRYPNQAVDNCRRLRDGQDLVNIVNGNRRPAH